jgi:ABC-type sugar transport system ATPase subunit
MSWKLHNWQFRKSFRESGVYMSDTILALRNLSKSYPGVQALKDVSLDIHRGEVHALVGENGAGKSTLIKIIAGAIKPDGGMMILEDTRYNDDDAASGQRSRYRSHLSGIQSSG